MKQLFLLLSMFFVFSITSNYAQKVYVTKSGDKYHSKDCQYAKKDATEMNLSDAVAKKLKPCTVCNPDKKVFVTKTGDKYHTKDCQYAKDATEMLLTDAKAKGLKVCSTCNPDGGKTEPKTKDTKKK